jgi:hypothetical protein
LEYGIKNLLQILHFLPKYVIIIHIGEDVNDNSIQR